MVSILERRRCALAAQRPPNQLAERITGRPYLSHSQLALMRSCPRKFAFQYVEKAQPDFIASSLIFGGAIHAVLELFFRARLEGLTVTPAAMLAAYHDAWRREREASDPAISIRFNQGETHETLDALADRMITTFLASSLASPKGKILGVEEELRVVLDPDLPDLLARVDLVTQTDGALHVIDFKTSRSRWTDEKAQESSDQLLLYGATVARMSQYLGVPVHLHFAILTKAKTPIVQLLPVLSNPGRVAGVKDAVRQVWDAIQAGVDYPSPSPLACATCGFKSQCPIFASR